MPTPQPDQQQVLQAMDIYLKTAYQGDLPLRVRSQQGILESWGGPFFQAPIFVADNNTPPRRYTIRLGNSFYPHMKLAIEMAPHDEGWLFRVDTHDRHCCPNADAPEYSAFCQLMERNQKQAEMIEAEWEQAGLPTFKSYLREDLKRRQAQMAKT
jgi:hypothetical protein